MLKLTGIEFLFRVIPEAFMFMLGAFVFSNTRLRGRSFLKVGSLLAIVVLLIRSLPISYGIHTLLIIAASIVLVYKYCSINLLKAIKAIIFTVTLQFLAELMNLLWIEKILDKNIEVIFHNSVNKVIYGFPSFVIMFIVIGIYYILRVKKGNHV